ncbi:MULTISPECIES: recombinase zinc beta ribbon domain-containing protein [unclassified Ruminococcus]|uniref:recombinase zinc beta ribbon domain-containing protein n=1 Tax=Ruminococcus sp. zg-924 TaxID=2678505 RepID=UPI00210957B6
MLANEKYTGDVIFQKTYTDDSFNRHINDGFLDQYFMPNHHEAIVSHEDFDAVAALISQRATEKGIKRGSKKCQQRYAFSGKIICGECGNTFRRRIHTSKYGKYVAWCCNTHLNDTRKCPMLFLRDDDLKIAFTTVLNKLIYSHKLVLKPYVAALKNNSGDESLVRIQHLERLLEQNTEQRETLTKLMAQGYIDQVLYNSETNALLAQANNYRADIDVINATMTGDSSKVFEAERLLHFAERGSLLDEYNEELFERFVDHIHVYSRQEVGFVMKCGLTFKEMI